jgi:hypothetical protein
MHMNLSAAAIALASISTLETPARAQQNGLAQLRLTIVDETHAPVPNAIVTIFTMYGHRTVNADQAGVVVVAGLPAGLTTQVWARTREPLENAEATKLKPGKNKHTLTLHPARPSRSQRS